MTAPAPDTPRPLRIVVLVKQVPDTANVTGEAMKEDGTINRAALPAVFNPEDLNALEEALQLKDRHGGRVTVITMGPPAAVAVLRESLYRGADEVILLTDKAFAGADTLATSYALAQAVRKVGAFDLVLCGRQAIDGDTAQVGPQTAEKLGVPQITCVSRIDEVVPAPRRTGARDAPTQSGPHRRDALGRGRLRDPAEPAAGAAHDHRRGQRPAAAERQARHDLQGRRRRGAARVRRHLPRPRADEAAGLHARPRRPTGVPRPRRAVGPRDRRRRARAGRPARLAHARQGDRERRAGAERGAHGRARPRTASPGSCTS